MSRKRDGYSVLTGTRNDIPILDTRVYNILFPDGHYEQYTTNVITESLTSSYNCEGYDKATIKGICGYQKSTSCKYIRWFLYLTK